MEKSCPTRQESIIRLPSYPEQANFSYISFQNKAFCYMKNKKLALLEGLPA